MDTVRRPPNRPGPDLFVNARTDTHWLAVEPDEIHARLAAYQQAGADGVFVPGVRDPARIAALAAAVTVPLNVLYAPGDPGGPGVAELGRLGARRISPGSLLYRRALSAALEAAEAVRVGEPVPPGALSYAEVAGLDQTIRGAPPRSTTHGVAPGYIEKDQYST